VFVHILQMLNKVIEGKFDEISKLQEQLSEQKDLVKESNETNERLMKVCPISFPCCKLFLSCVSSAPICESVDPCEVYLALYT